MPRILIVGGGYAGFHTAWRVSVDLGAEELSELEYDVPVITAGAVTRRLPVPGVADKAIGLKHVEEALGLARGIFQSGPVVIKGFPTRLMHRGYHVLAVPSRERKIRLLTTRLLAVVFGRDIVSLWSVQHPHAAFIAAGDRRAEP